MPQKCAYHIICMNNKRSICYIYMLLYFWNRYSLKLIYIQSIRQCSI